MVPVKLDSPVKVFVVFVALDSLEQLAAKVMYTDTLCISVSDNFSKTQEQLMETRETARGKWAAQSWRESEEPWGQSYRSNSL